MPPLIKGYLRLGARIGDGCVVAANSVVRGEVEANSVVAGSPARVVGRRG